MTRTRACLRALLTTALLVPLAACGSQPDPVRQLQGSPAGFPFTVTNCGVQTTFDAPPKRAVTMNQHTTEILLALGLGDRIVGTAYLDDAILARYRSDYQGIKVLAKEYPSKEVLLAAAPDFVYGGYTSAFDEGAGRDRAGLEKSGVATRLSVEYCTEGKVGLDQLRTEITEVARVFGVPERGARLLAEGQRRIEAVKAKVSAAEHPSVFVYDSGDNTAFTSGGHGIGNEIISLAGGDNVFSDLKDTFGDVSWEQVVQRRPEVVVIYDYGGTTVEAKKKRLLQDPALREVPAVRDRRFAVLPLSSAVLGVRVADAVEELARQLHPAAR
ncbi:ABC transporter substrate-binding protein [Streptomyces sp. NPDC006879]|uniref:ABC transporter substrate-binding protein n=1 Tax=Streptomyces sp. NPDC006879 TaxID=3364767 RepID=UPI003687E1CC